MPMEGPPAVEYPSTVIAAAILVLLSCALVVGYIDRQILALLIEPIKSSFGLSDLQAGALHGVAMSLCYALASVPVGRLIDRHNRRNLMFVCILCWSFATALCGLARSYEQLFMARMVVGVAETGLFPAAYSLMADLFPPRRQVTVNLIYYALGLVGSATSLALGGYVEVAVSNNLENIPTWLGVHEPWRLTFLFVGLPGVLLGGVFLLFKEPTRHNHVGLRDGQPGALVGFVRRNWRTYFWLYALVFGTGLTIGTVVTWSPTMLVRSYGMEVGHAGIMVGFGVCAGSVSGVVAGGLWNRLRAPRPCNGQILDILAISAGAAAAALGVMWFGWSPLAAAIMLAAFVFVFFVGYPLLASLVVSISPGHAIGQFLAVYVLTSMGAESVQSLLVGFLSDHLFFGQRGLLHALVSVAAVGAVITILAAVQIRAPFADTATKLGALPGVEPPESAQLHAKVSS